MIVKKKNLQKFFFSTFFLCFGFYRLRIERNRIESKYQWFGFLTIGSVRFATKNRNQTNRFGLDIEPFRGVQTAINTIFYVAFAFMSQEKLVNYTWVLLQLKNLYVKLSLSFPVVMATDCEKALANAIRLEFPQTSHVFCIWHINNNVLINCKKAFNSKEAWETFFGEWKAVMYANSEAEYNTA
jgi:hypothetical protein